PDFNQLLDEVAFDLQQHQRMAYAVLFDADAFTIDDLRARNIQVLNILSSAHSDRSEQLGVLLAALARKVDSTRQPAPPMLPTTASSLSVAQSVVSGTAAAAPQDEYEYDAFVSYHQKDLEWVETVLQPQLERSGLRLCLPDRDFAIGAPRLTNMENAVARSRKTLLILTPNWGTSQWSEFQRLLVQSSDPSGTRQRVLPLIVRPSSLPASLDYLTPLDLTDATKFERQIRRLIDAIRSTPGDAPATPASSPGHSAPPALSPKSLAGDGRLDYERGLRVLEQYVPADDGSDWRDFELYKSQLLSNLSDERRFGSTETLRSERSKVIDKLNPLALRIADLSFTDLCLGKTVAR
ncbi:MAG: toll/interleukin-1 receptor domain-containing protein, partial [Roseiflexaceae bacterium]